MAHNLMTNESGEALFADSRKPAWHGLGKVIPQAKTMAELARAVGLDFQYTLESIFFEKETIDDTLHFMMQGKKAIVRSGNIPVGLAVVGEDYELVQPYETIADLDALIKASKSEWKPETCLALGQGETTAFSVSIGNWNVTGDDQVEDYFLISDTVDGRHSRQLSIVSVRTVCQNTLRLALRTASVKLNLRHGTGMRDDNTQAIKAIYQSQKNVREALTKLSQRMITREKLEQYVKDVFRMPESDDEIESSRFKAICQRVDDQRSVALTYAVAMHKEQGLPLSAWCAYNGVTETIEHSTLFGGPIGTKKSLLLAKGPAYEMSVRAYDYARQM